MEAGGSRGAGSRSGRLVALLEQEVEPRADPLDRNFFGKGAGAGIVQHGLADAAGAEGAEGGVEPLAAEAESLCIGAIAERDHAIGDARQIGLALLEIAEQFL